MDNAFVGAWLSYCHSVTVSSVRYTKHCVDGQPSEHSLWHTLVTSIDGGNNAATKIDSRYCYDFGQYSVRVPYVLVDVVLILHVSLTSKITIYGDVIYHYFNIFPPWRQKNREARSTALQPIHLITRRVVLGRDCISLLLFNTIGIIFWILRGEIVKQLLKNGVIVVYWFCCCCSLSAMQTSLFLLKLTAQFIRWVARRRLFISKSEQGGPSGDDKQYIFIPIAQQPWSVISYEL